MVLVKGDVVLAQFPFTDLSQVKLRPAIVLQSSQPKDEITICFVSSQKINQLTEDEFALLETDLEFPSTGLRISSKIRVTRIVTLSRQLISKRLGQLGTTQIQTLNTKLKKSFQIP